MANPKWTKEEACDHSGISVIPDMFKHDQRGRIKCPGCERLIKTTPHPCLDYGQTIIAPHKKPEHLKKHWRNNNA